HEVDRAAGQAARPDPDVGLDVADQVADVEVAVAVGQGAGDDRGAGHVDAGWEGRGLSHGAKCNGRRSAGRASCPRRRVRYWRSQTCDLQMKATQPDTCSRLPPSISAIFDR